MRYFLIVAHVQNNSYSGMLNYGVQQFSGYPTRSEIKRSLIKQMKPTQFQDEDFTVVNIMEFKDEVDYKTYFELPLP